MKLEIEISDEDAAALRQRSLRGLQKVGAIVLAELPKPLPTRLGAMVKTDRGVFLLAEPTDLVPWFSPSKVNDSRWHRVPVGKVLETREGPDW